jgi:hypothetical protein
MNMNAANLYSAAQTERAAATQRAAEPRRRLLERASGIGAEGTEEEDILIGHWMDARPSQTPSDDQYHAAAAGKDSDFG